MLTGSTFARQIPTSSDLPVLQSYGVGACQAVASEVEGGVHRVYAGLGSALGVLDPTPSSPTLAGGLAKNPVHLLGFVRDVALVRGNGIDRAYVAAGPRGLVAYDVPAGDEGASNIVPHNAYAVAALDVEDPQNPGTFRRFVFVGTNDDDGAGLVHTFRHNVGGVFQPLGSLSVGGPVYSLAVSDEVLSPNVTLLVATACAGLQRYDVSAAELYTGTVDLSNDQTGLWPPNPVATPMFLRDVVIHMHLPSGGGVVPYAFVAAHHKGVYRLTMSPFQEAPDPSGKWQLSTASGNAKGLALVDAPGNVVHLAVAQGGLFRGERQFLGTAALPTVCDADEASVVSAMDTGVHIFDLGATTGSTLGDSPISKASSGGEELMTVSIRDNGSSGYFLDTAADAGGYVRYEYDAGTSTVSLTGDFAKNGNVLVNASDDVLVASVLGKTVIYTALENGVSAHDLTGLTLNPGDPLPGPATPIDQGLPAVHIAGVSSTTPPFLVTTGDANGAVFNLTIPTDPVFVQNLTLPGRLHRNSFLVEEITPSPLPPGGQLASWLYATNNKQDPDLPVPGFSIVDLGDLLIGRPVTSADLVYHYVDVALDHLDCPTNTAGDRARNFGGMLVRKVSSLKHAVYVLYGPRQDAVFSSCTPSTVIGADTAGMMIFEVSWTLPVPPATSPVFSVQKVKDVVAFSGLPKTSASIPAFISYSGNATGRIYGAYSSIGVAQFTLNGDFDATATGTRSGTVAVDADTFDRSALLGFEENGQVYTCYLGGTPNMIAREPATSFGTTSTANIEFFATPMQPIYIRKAPGDPAGTVYVADGRGGIHRVLFP